MQWILLEALACSMLPSWAPEQGFVAAQHDRACGWAQFVICQRSHWGQSYTNSETYPFFLMNLFPLQMKKQCDQKLLIRMKTECVPCSLNLETQCPAGYTKITNGTGIPDCRYFFCLSFLPWIMLSVNYKILICITNYHLYAVFLRKM